MRIPGRAREDLAIQAVVDTSSRTRLAVRRLPPLSPVAVRLLLLVRQQDVNYRSVCDVLHTDAALSAAVLRLANSAAIGCRFPSSSVLQALTVLGIPRISAFAVSLAVCKFLRPVAKLPILKLCWRHNLATAIVSAELASRYGLEPDFAYTFGLLHDIGRLGLLVAFTQDYTKLAETPGVERSLGLVDLERREFGFDHREVGAWLAEQWHLPADLVEVSLMHGPGAAPSSALARLVDEACQTANRLGFSIWEPETPPEADNTGIAERVRSYEVEYGL